MKKILVVCGMGSATSTIANKTISEYLKQKGIQATITQAKVTEMNNYSGQMDCIVLMATGATVPDSMNAPVIKGLPFLTGVGKDAALDAVVAAIA